MWSTTFATSHGIETWKRGRGRKGKLSLTFEASAIRSALKIDPANVKTEITMDHWARKYLFKCRICYFRVQTFKGQVEEILMRSSWWENMQQLNSLKLHSCIDSKPRWFRFLHLHLINHRNGSLSVSIWILNANDDADRKVSDGVVLI